MPISSDLYISLLFPPLPRLRRRSSLLPDLSSVVFLFPLPIQCPTSVPPCSSLATSACGWPKRTLRTSQPRRNRGRCRGSGGGRPRKCLRNMPAESSRRIGGNDAAFRTTSQSFQRFDPVEKHRPPHRPFTLVYNGLPSTAQRDRNRSLRRRRRGGQVRRRRFSRRPGPDGSG